MSRLAAGDGSPATGALFAISQDVPTTREALVAKYNMVGGGRTLPAGRNNNNSNNSNNNNKGMEMDSDED